MIEAFCQWKQRWKVKVNQKVDNAWPAEVVAAINSLWFKSKAKYFSVSIIVTSFQNEKWTLKLKLCIFRKWHDSELMKKESVRVLITRLGNGIEWQQRLSCVEQLMY